MWRSSKSAARPVVAASTRLCFCLLLILTATGLALPACALGSVPRGGRDLVAAAPEAGVHVGGAPAHSIPRLKILGFAPASGPVGTSVVIRGYGFGSASVVKFNGRTAASHRDDGTQLEAEVPVGATTGRISVTDGSETALSADTFTVTAVPTVTGFSPTSGAAGSSVSITGTGLSDATRVSFNGRSATFTVAGDSRLTATVPSGATSGRIAVTTPGGTATSASSFTVTNGPSITSLAPTEGPVRTVVTLTGRGFTGTRQVTFNGHSGTYTVRSDTLLTATVPPDATSGQVVVTTSGGASTSVARFTVTPPPSVSSFTPTSGPVGTNVTIRGAGFTGTTSVKFGATEANFRVVDKGQITATVPTGAGSGTIRVTNPGGSGTSATSFVVLKAPTITAFSPTSGPARTSVTITGTGFTGATRVAFNGVNASTFSVASSTQIRATVPSGATSGPLTVTTPGGTASSTGSFTVIPAPMLSFFTPDAGPVGTVVTLVGSGLSGATWVTFGGVRASFTVLSATQITASVPAGATSGPIVVTTPGGTAESASSFTVIPTPVIERLNRRSAARGATVIVGGSGFGDARGESSVRFGDVPCAAYPSWSATRITCKVPATARLGRVNVTVVTAGGTSNAVSFKVKK